MQHTQRSEGWRKQRQGRVTGSVVGAILGLAPYMTREDVVRSMVRAYHGGIRAQQEPQFKSIWEQPHYYAQIQVQLHCCGRKWCDFWQWTPHGTKLERVDYDPEWINNTLPSLRQFHAEYLSELDNPEHLEPLRVQVNTQEAKRLLDEYDDLKEAIDNAKDRQKELQAQLIELSGEKDADIWGRKLTKVQKQGSISYAKALKDIAPNAKLEPYRGKETEYWKLT